jgi:hypothetical protein
MHRLSAALLALATVAPCTASAAEITKIASSFEDKAPFGMFIDVGYERTQHRAKIVREFQQSGDVQDVTELRYTDIDSRLNLNLHLGLWKDFEFHYGLPIVFQQNRTWGYAVGTGDFNSTIANNCLAASGELLDPACAVSGAGRQSMFPLGSNINNYRGGLGNMTFGFAYAFFNQAKDDTKPTWILGVDYTAPTADLNDPTVPTSPDSRGALGDRNHRYKVYSTISKRVGAADPYFQIHYTLAYHGPGWYSNCDHPNSQNMGRPDNCGTDVWSRADTGDRPPHVGGIIFGSEFNAYDQPSMHQKVAIDLRGIATYVSEGRYYNEMSDLFQKLLYTQEYLEVGGMFGFTAHAAEYVHLRASATWLYRTEYTLTDESIGKDANGNGTVDITNSPIEINPNYDWRSDMTSRRFRASETSIFRIDVTGTINF